MMSIDLLLEELSEEEPRKKDYLEKNIGIDKNDFDLILDFLQKIGVIDVKEELGKVSLSQAGREIIHLPEN